MDGLSISTGSISSEKSPGGLETKVQQPNPGTDGASFSDTLGQAVDKVNHLQQEADFAMQNLATGKSQNIHETMIKAEKADIALKLMLQVRNKIVDAYQEIMRMQV